MTKQLEGKKSDQGKEPWHLLPYDALTEVVKVLQHGEQKYTARNWEKGMNWSRLHAATNRHLNQKWWQKRETEDAESGLMHLAHATCDLLFLLAYELRSVGEDDRPEVIT